MFIIENQSNPTNVYVIYKGHNIIKNSGGKEYSSSSGNN